MSTDPLPAALNTVSMLGQAYSLLGFQIVNGVVGAGYRRSPSTQRSSRRSIHRAPGSHTWRTAPT